MIRSMFINANPESAYHYADLYKNDRKTYDEEVRKYTQEHAKWWNEARWEQQ